MLFDAILRYRMYPVALVGDVRKACHHLEVVAEDRDYLRFLWVEDRKDLLSRVCEWRFTPVIFGAGPSPFLLNATLKKHIEEHEQEDPRFVRKVVRSVFVDDFVGGGRNSKEVMRLRKKLIEVMHKGGLTLHKWKSNSQELCQMLLKKA